MHEKTNEKNGTGTLWSIIKNSIFGTLLQGIKGDLELYGRITAVINAISTICIVTIVVACMMTTHSPHNIFWAVTSPSARWIKWFYFLLSLCFGLWSISWSYLKLAIYSLDKNETRLKFSWTIFYLFLFLLGSFFLLSSLYHIGVWTNLNRTLVDAMIFFSAEWRTDMAAFLAQCRQELNVISIVTSFLGTGLLVLSLSNDRHRSNLNPYTLQEYFPVLPFLCALLFVLMALIYFMTVRLFALMLVATVIHVSICVAIPVFFHVLHTPQHIAYQMADVLLKKVKNLKRHKRPQNNEQYYKRWPMDPDFLSIMKDMTLWKRQLMQNAQGTTLGDSLYAQAKYHALALERACKKIPSVLSNEKEDAWSYFSFAMGLLLGAPAYGVKDELQRNYFRFMFKELKENNESSVTLTNVLMRGMIAARLLEAYRPVLREKKEGIQQDTGAESTNDDEKQYAQNIRFCIEDVEYALGTPWNDIFETQPDGKKLLKMWIYHMIVARIPNCSYELHLKYINVNELKDTSDELWKKPCFDLADSLWKLYLTFNYIDTNKMDYLNAQRAFDTIRNRFVPRSESDPTVTTPADLNSKEFDNTPFQGKMAAAGKKRAKSPIKNQGKGKKQSVSAQTSLRAKKEGI